MRERRPTTRTIGGGLLAAVLLGALPAGAQSLQDRLVFHPNLQTDLRPTLEHPMRLGPRGELKAPEPVWTRSGLWATRPNRLWGLAKSEDAGLPVWDPTTNAWYAWSMGALVEVKPDGRLPVLLDPFPSRDFDIRAALGLVVYADPDTQQIVLQRLDGDRDKRVLLTGNFFNPRFSPDGKKVVVSESRSQGGHIWLVPLRGDAPRDLGRGNQPSWHPDSQQVFFARFENDGRRHTSSSVFQLDLRAGSPRQLAVSRDPILTRPTISPDGSWIALADEQTGELLLARLPTAERR
ncbi:MAG: TolB family protein [Myxococcales bacterium]|jgi:hypothetical protein